VSSNVGSSVLGTGGACRAACPRSASSLGAEHRRAVHCDGRKRVGRCRADYVPTADGNQLRLNIRCASDSYRFELASNVQNRGGRISGEWSETSRNARGDLSGRASGNRIEALARSDMFTANLSLTTTGKRQTVAIEPQGTEVQRVSLALSKR
jgi:hypothetical protein